MMLFYPSIILERKIFYISTLCLPIFIHFLILSYIYMYMYVCKIYMYTHIYTQIYPFLLFWILWIFGRWHSIWSKLAILLRIHSRQREVMDGGKWLSLEWNTLCFCKNETIVIVISSSGSGDGLCELNYLCKNV